MPIEAKVDLTKEERTRFFSFNLQRQNTFKNPIYILPITIIIFIVANLTNIKQVDFNLIGFALLLLFTFYIINFISEVHSKALEKMLEGPIVYSFTDNTFEIKDDSNLPVNILTFSYPAIHKVYEMPAAFYIYITNKQFYIIPKSDIIAGNLEELSKFLKSKVDKNKYKTPYVFSFNR